MNYIWALMILLGIIIASFTGNMGQVTVAIVDSSKEAINLCIVMLGVVGMWSGVMSVAEKSGIIDKLTKLMKPLLVFLFPKLSMDSKAINYISTNMVANVLGIGWAATQSGLKAMEELGKIAQEKNWNIEQYKKNHIATNEMCTFLVINISSLQLIPVNIIAYRSQYGSVYPAAILGPALIATFISTLVGIIFCKIAMKKLDKE